MELHQKKKVHDLWKRGLASYGEYRVCTLRKYTRKSKSLLQLTQATVVSNNKKSFFKVSQQQKEVKGNHQTDN